MFYSKWHISALAAIIILCSFDFAAAETNVSGSLNQSSIWTKAAGPYIVLGDFTIPEGISLIIKPGTEVKINRNKNIIVHGKLSAVGTQDQRIIFTGNTFNANAPYWGSLVFDTKYGDPSELKYCDIRCSGGTEKAPIVLKGTVTPLTESNIYSNNRFKAIEIEGGRYSSNLTLKPLGLPFLIQSDIEILFGTTMEIAAGTVLKFAADANITINGTLRAQGSKDKKIYFTSVKDDAADGIDTGGDSYTSGSAFDWGGIYFSKFCNNELTVISNAEFRYGGGSQTTYNAMLVFDGCSPKIEMCELSESGYHGAYCINDASPDFGGGSRSSVGMNIWTGFKVNKFAIFNNSEQDISAKNNCWGTLDAAEIEKIIYDKTDKSKSGRVEIYPFFEECIPAPPKTPVLISPENNAEDLEQPIEFKWNYTFMASSYRLLISRDSSFRQNDVQYGGLTDTAETIKGLELKTRYYWKLKAFNTLGESAWTPVYTFTTYDTSRPESPRLLEPADKQTTSCETAFSWEAQKNDKHYKIQIARDAVFRNIILSRDSITVNSFLHKFSNNGEKYYFRVAAANRNGFGSWSATREFNIENLFTRKAQLPGLIRSRIEFIDIDNDSEAELIISGDDALNKSTLYIFKAQDDGYAPMETEISALTESSLSWADYDNDGDADLLQSGKDDAHVFKTIIWRNQNGIFYKITPQTGAWTEALSMWYDADGDGREDIFICGKDAQGELKAKVYLQHTGVFDSSDFNCEGLLQSTAATADFDGDMRKDIILSGVDEHGESKMMIIYNRGDSLEIMDSGFTGYRFSEIQIIDHNADSQPDIFISGSGDDNTKYRLLINKGGVFEEEKTEFDNLTKSIDNPKFRWGDFDNDGMADFLVNGFANGTAVTYFISKQEGEYIKTALSTELAGGAIAAGNLNNQGALDYVISGSDQQGNLKTVVFENSSCTENIKPGVPVNLRYRFSEGKLILEWDAAANALAYNVRLGTKPGGSERLSSLTNNDFSAMPIQSFSTMQNSYSLSDVQSGHYYASVQSVNNAYQLSPFSESLKIRTPDLAADPPTSWKYETQTGENTTVLLRTENIKLDNLSRIKSGDAVGVFYLRENRLVCGGYAIWDDGRNIAITVWGDNNLTEEVKDGFDYSESFRFKIWDASNEIEYPTSVRYESGLSYFAPDTLTVVSEFKALDTVKLSVLGKSWTMVSANVIPYIADLGYLLDANVQCMKDAENHTYFPAKGVRDFSSWDSMKGYEVFADQADTILLEGNLIQPENSPLMMNARKWYILPYFLTEEHAADDALKSIREKILLMKDSYGRVYCPEYDFDEIGKMYPGSAYKILLAERATLIYPELSPDEEQQTAQTETEYYTHETESTGNNCQILILSEQINSGDEVAAFSLGGQMYGAAAARDGYCFLTVHGDNSMTAEKDAAEYKEALVLKIFKKAENKEYLVKILAMKDKISGNTVEDLFYRQDSYSEIIAELGEVTSVANISDTAPTIALSPNPADDFINFGWSTEIAGRAVIKICDLKGNVQKLLKDKSSDAGSYSEVYDIKELAPGAYIMVFEINGQRTTKKIIIE